MVYRQVTASTEKDSGVKVADLAVKAPVGVILRARDMQVRAGFDRQIVLHHNSARVYRGKGDENRNAGCTGIYGNGYVI